MKGKTAAVLGGAGLLGGEIASALAQSGARVLLLDENAEEGEKIVSELIRQGFKAEFIAFDVTELESVESRIDELWDGFGPIHVFLNSSYPRTRDWGTKCEDVPLSSWQKNVDMQLNSAFAAARAMAEHMRQSSVPGSIINLASIYGVVGNDFTIYENTEMSPPVAYSAIKGGIVNLTRYMASYYGKFNIRVNTLCPGGVLDRQDPVFVRQYSNRTPLKRLGNPDEVASAALFLACDASSYITGTAFMVDGGWTAI